MSDKSTEDNYAGVWDTGLGFGEKSAVIVIDLLQGQFDVDSVVPGDFDAEDVKRLQHLLDAHAHRFFPENHG